MSRELIERVLELVENARLRERTYGKVYEIDRDVLLGLAEAVENHE